MSMDKNDITPQQRELLERLVKERTEELERTRERLFLANQVKAEFLAHMSRELRTPLDYIIAFAGLMLEGERGELNAGQKECLANIVEHSRRLRGMVDRILELCNLDIGMARFLPRRLAAAATIARAVERVREMANRAGISIVLRCKGKIGTIAADENKFSFILEELLTNALKFSPTGSEIRVSARMVKVPGDGVKKFLEVAVTDQGPGIGPEESERIFFGFERGYAVPPAAGSLGIGLALVKRFVELHGGRIWVQSRPGRGSTFSFLLPTEGPLVPKGVTPRVMLAEVDPDVRQMLTRYMKEEGYEVIVAGDGQETLTKGLSSPPDLFFLEVALPEISGIEVCLRLKSHAATKHIPVILTATLAGQSEKRRSAEAGADNFFSKPFDMNELLPKIRTLVTQKLNYDLLKRSYEIAEAEAGTDPLTGLCNPRQFWQTLERELERARRYRHHCSLAMIDIDFFKNYNDRFGHLQGDEVLKEAAEIFRQNIRKPDIAARYGGEEFVIIMPETNKELAMVVGEKLRRAFEAYPFPLQEAQPGGSLTISIGIATFPQDGRNGRELVNRADKALYRSKKGGRNRVEGWGVCPLARCPAGGGK